MNAFLFLMLKLQLLESTEITNLVHIETIIFSTLFLIVLYVSAYLFNFFYFFLNSARLGLQIV